MLRVVATVEARMGSTRLPGKVLLPAAGRPLLLHLVERARRARLLDEVVVATTTLERDEVIVTLCEQHGIPVHRGSEEHVLERVVAAGKAHGAEVSVLLTGDNPLIDPHLIDLHVATYLAHRGAVDFVTNGEVRSYPLGLDLQVLSWETLAGTLPLATTPSYRENVGWYVRRHPERYRRLDVVAPPELSNPFLRLTVDTSEDYERVRDVFEELLPENPDFTIADVLAHGRRRGWID